MEKIMSIGAMAVSALLFVIFLLDLTAGFPFSTGTPEEASSPYTMVDIFGLLGSGIVAYLGFNAYQDVK